MMGVQGPCIPVPGGRGLGWTPMHTGPAISGYVQGHDQGTSAQSRAWIRQQQQSRVPWGLRKGDQ